MLCGFLIKQLQGEIQEIFSMASVTQRITQIKQPYGGYLPTKTFSKEIFNDGFTLSEKENIHSSLIGIAVDYLTRFSLGDSVHKAFRISCLGASNIGMLNKATALKTKIKGLDDQSIISACKLAGFDVCFRASKSAYKPIENINPDMTTIKNIRIMVSRSVYFWNKYGPIVSSEPTFEGGYTDTVNAGDGDFLSKDTLWDFKVLKSAPTSKHTLQILMYYVMGLHSTNEHFKNITNIGFFNPRLNIAYICPVSCISPETIAEVENNVICYGVSLPFNENNRPLPKTKTSQADEYTVTDICNITGFKKSVVYADIRSGYLRAHKKGNKYCITKENCYDYIVRKKIQQKIQIVITIVAAVVSILIMFFMMSKI